MARQEEDREDLLREATALVERVEYQLSEHAEPIVVGFRRDGSASFFLGADPVYQFNSAGLMRRAYVAGRLIKAERGRLVALRRERSEGQAALVRHELTPAESDAFLTHARQQLSQLLEAIREGQAQRLREAPEGADLTPRVLAWLDRHADAFGVAQTPRVG